MSEDQTLIDATETIHAAQRLGKASKIIAAVRTLVTMPATTVRGARAKAEALRISLQGGGREDDLDLVSSLERDLNLLGGEESLDPLHEHDLAPLGVPALAPDRIFSQSDLEHAAKMLGVTDPAQIQALDRQLEQAGRNASEQRAGRPSVPPKDMRKRFEKIHADLLKLVHLLRAPGEPTATKRHREFGEAWLRALAAEVNDSEQPPGDWRVERDIAALGRMAAAASRLAQTPLGRPGAAGYGPAGDRLLLKLAEIARRFSGKDVELRERPHGDPRYSANVGGEFVLWAFDRVGLPEGNSPQAVAKHWETLQRSERKSG